jgi:hypothetical protein
MIKTKNMASTENLWPKFEAKKLTSPKTLLLEQANYLSESTRNVIIGNVISTSDPTKINGLIHQFKVEAPALKNYSYSLFYIQHFALFYPLNFFYDNFETVIRNEAELMNKMKEVFNDPRTIELVNALYSQSIE